MIIETVKIESAESPTGYRIINKSDLREDVDVLFGAPIVEVKEVNEAPRRGRKGKNHDA